MKKRYDSVDEMIDDMENGSDEGQEYHVAAGSKSAEHDSVPDEISILMEELGQVKTFTVTIYRVSNGQREYVQKYDSYMPEPDKIGTEFGPGEYHIVSSWPVPGTKTPRTKRLKLVISQSYESKHREFLRRNSPVQSEGVDVFSVIEKVKHLIVPPKETDNTALLLKLMETQNNAMREEMRRDREAADLRFQMMLETMKQNNRPEPSFLDRLQEIKAFQEITQSGGTAPALPDERPVWIQVMDSLADKVAPLLEVFAENKNGIKQKIAVQKVRKAMETQMGKKLMESRQQQSLLLENIIKQNPGKEESIKRLAGALNIEMPKPEGT